MKLQRKQKFGVQVASTALLGWAVLGGPATSLAFEPPDGVPAPPRLSAVKNGSVSLLLYDDPIADVPENVRYLYAGRYDEAIAQARKELAQLATWQRLNNEPQADGRKFRDALRVLAEAQELRGDWKEALGNYATLYGAGREFRWAEARIMYATGAKKEAFAAVCSLIKTEYAPFLDTASLVEEMKNVENKFRVPNAYLYDVETGEIDRRRLALYRLRDNCARVVCPELYYAVGSSRNPELDRKNRDALRRESFERFLAEMEAELATIAVNDATQRDAQIRFLRDLAKLP